MSQPRSQIPMPSADKRSAKHASSEEVAEANFERSSTAATQVLGEMASYMSIAEAGNVEMTMMKMTTTRTTGEDWSEDQTTKETTDMKMSFKRKFCAEKDATRDIPLIRSRSSAPYFQNQLLRRSPKTLHAVQQAKSHAHRDLTDPGDIAWKSALAKILNNARRRRSIPLILDQVQSGTALQSPNSGADIASLAQASYSEAIDVTVQTSLFQGGQGFFFLPSSTSSSPVTRSSVASSVDFYGIEYGEGWERNNTAKPAEDTYNYNSFPSSTRQSGSGFTKNSTSLVPSASSFIPGLFLDPQNLEVMQRAVTPLIDRNGRNNAVPIFSTASKASPFTPQPVLYSQNLQIMQLAMAPFTLVTECTPDMAQNSVIVSKPTEDTVMARPVAIHPPPRTLSPPSTASSVLALSDLPIPSAPKASQHPLPYPPQPPSTPTLGSSSRFGDLIPRQKTPKSKGPSCLATSQSQKPSKPQNPYIDFTKFSGNDSADKFYEVYPIMRAYRKHKMRINPDLRFVGPYRHAAVWEIIGHTFAKDCREPPKKRKKKRHAEYAAKAAAPREHSTLCDQVPTTQEEESRAKAAFEELERLQNGEGSW